jgi:Family of unknown function (DUF6282)
MDTVADVIDKSLTEDVAGLMVGAVDLHCHSGPAAMPRMLDHHEAMLDAAAAGFEALVYKDHYYAGMAHAKILQKLVPYVKTQLYSGIALNNASGGVNPHAVDHAIKLGAKIVWMPTFSARNHIDKSETEAKNFPKSIKPMLKPTPLSVLDENGKLTKDTLQVLDLIAEGDIILAGGHLSAHEQIIMFEEAKRRGVKKMLVNHPTYVIGCSDDDIRRLVSLGVFMEHSICMFIAIEGRQRKQNVNDLSRLIGVAGVDHTILGSDLGLVGMPRPVEGYRRVIEDLLRAQYREGDIRKLVGRNAVPLL